MITCANCTWQFTEPNGKLALWLPDPWAPKEVTSRTTWIKSLQLCSASWLRPLGGSPPRTPPCPAPSWDSHPRAGSQGSSVFCSTSTGVSWNGTSIWYREHVKSYYKIDLTDESRSACHTLKVNFTSRSHHHILGPPSFLQKVSSCCLKLSPVKEHYVGTEGRTAHEKCSRFSPEAQE